MTGTIFIVKGGTTYTLAEPSSLPNMMKESTPMADVKNLDAENGENTAPPTNGTGRTREAKPVSADPSKYTDPNVLEQIPTLRVPQDVYGKIVAVAAAIPGKVADGMLVKGAIADAVRPVLFQTFYPERDESFDAWLARTSKGTSEKKKGAGRKVSVKAQAMDELFGGDLDIPALMADMKAKGMDTAQIKAEIAKLMLS